MSNASSRRAVLRAAPPMAVAAKLDSSLKKNLSYVKRIRAVSADSLPTLLADTAALLLAKYVLEISQAFAEGAAKAGRPEDLWAAVQVAQALHQRFGADFAGPVLGHLASAATEKAPAGLLAKSPPKAAAALKMVFEMCLLGLVSSLSSADPACMSPYAAKLAARFPQDWAVVPLLKDVLSHETETGYGLACAASFVRRFPFIFDAADAEQGPPGPGFAACKADLARILTSYTQRLLSVLSETHSRVLGLEEAAAKALIRTGRVLEDREQAVAAAVEFRDELRAQLEGLAAAAGLEMPHLETHAPKQQPKAHVDVVRDGYVDAREREFYTNVPEYLAVLGGLETRTWTPEELALAGKDVEVLCQALTDMASDASVDEATRLLHGSVPYNRATKNRLLRLFTDGERVDSVAYFARFLKSNHAFFPDLVADLADALDKGFRSQMAHGRINFRNLAFFIELVKFKLVPPHVVFHKIRRMTLDISLAANTDILLIFYERCGRWLLAEPDYCDTTREMLALLHTQAKSDKLLATKKLALANMFLIVESFDAPRQVAKPERLSLLEDYTTQAVSRLVHINSIAEAEKALNAVDVAAPEPRAALVRLFTNPQNFGHDTLPSMARLLANLGARCRPLVAEIVERLHESVVEGLELNLWLSNNARIAQMRFFGHLFNAAVIPQESVLDLLSKVVCFGHPANFPTPAGCELDPNDNYFRLHMVCALLQAITQPRFRKSEGFKSLRGFLSFFQYYRWCKLQPVPQEYTTNLTVTALLYCDVHRTPISEAQDLQHAISILQEFTQSSTTQQSRQGVARVKTTLQTATPEPEESPSVLGYNSSQDDVADDESNDDDAYNDSDDNDDENDEEDVEDDDDDSDDDARKVGFASDSEDGSEDETGFDSDASFSGSESSDDESVEIRRLEQYRAAREAQQQKELFDAEYQMLVSGAAPTTRQTQLRIPAPVTAGPVALAGAGVGFRLLGRGGSKTVALPEGNRFSARILQEQADQRANRAKIMQLVDNME